MARHTQIARPAARKTAAQQPRRRTATGGTKTAKARSSAQGGGASLSSRPVARKPEPAVQVTEQVTRRRFAEPPKVAGELPTPIATFYF